MGRLVIRGLLTRKLRSVLTAVAIVLGVAMISGTFVLTDQISGAFDAIFQASNKGTDAVVKPNGAFGSDANAQVPLFVPESLVPRVKQVDGVRAVNGELTENGYLVVNGAIVKPSGGAPAILASESPDFRVSKLVAGHFPREGAGSNPLPELALDKRLADRKHVKVGQQVQIATASGLHAARVSAIIKFPASSGGATIMSATLPVIQKWFGKQGQLSEIRVAADPGVSQQQLANRVRAAVGTPRIEVKTGVQDAKDQAGDINKAIGSFLTPALLAFGVIALFVGAFIIFNTFSITVAQRLREFAMLRTLGATRRQVLQAVTAEALVIGLLSSVIGLACGYLVAIGIGALFSAVGFGLPTNSPSLAVRTVVLALIVGVGVTLLASLGPARRATRIPPIAALREGAVLPRGRFARFAPVLAVLLALGGLLLILQGFSGSGSVSQRLLGMGVGALLVFIAVAMLARFVVRPVTRVLGWPLEQLAGTTGRLARENAMRNPARTARTAAALMIGLGLVVFVSVFAQGLKDGFRSAVTGSLKSNVVMQSSTFLPMPAGAAKVAKADPDIALVSSIVSDDARLNGGGTHTIEQIDPSTFGHVWKLKWKQGSDATYSALNGRDVLVADDLAKSHRLQLGSTFSLDTRSGKTATYVLRGTYDANNSPLTGFLMAPAAFQKISANRDPINVFAQTKAGSKPETVVARIQQRLAKTYPIVEIKTSSQFVKAQLDGLNPIIYLLYALLAMSVIISLFGIVNSLVLSIFERTREIGMLRAIGLSRRQTRRMVRYESVITSVIGGILGTVVGLFFGWVMAKGLQNQGIQFSVPVGQLIIFLLVSALAGVLSAILPARRASRVKILEALSYE
ncbi:MAG: putative transport system permease protein [Gaiellales bacterium]|nr:putative transport system permease protein [Gaiellales bacterium]